MPKSIESLHTFNRGLISPLALARTDIERVGMSAETCENWMPRNLGSMMLRPGTKHIGRSYSTYDGDTDEVTYWGARLIPFIFATDDTAVIEIASKIRFWVNDELLTRPVVSTSMPQWSSTGSNFVGITDATQANPCNIEQIGHVLVTGDKTTLHDLGGMVELNDNTTDYTVTVVDADNYTLDGIDATGYTAYTSGGSGIKVTDWTDNDESGAVSRTSASDGLILIGTGTNGAKREQVVTVAAGDQGIEHGILINVTRGKLTLRVGSSSGDDDYITEMELAVGHHNLALTPNGDFYVELSSRLKYPTHINTITLFATDYEAHLGTTNDIWLDNSGYWGASNRGNMRYDQSGDVIYVACAGLPQYKIIRWDAKSWSVVEYKPENGPFRDINTSKITITPSAISGEITLTASKPIFYGGVSGSVWRITSEGQFVSVTNISVEDTWTNTIRVTGILDSRVFTLSFADRTDSTMTLQRSLTSDEGPWEDVATYTNPFLTWAYDDGLDNQIAWYRMGVATGDYGTDAIDIELDYPLGSIDGYVQLVGDTADITPTTALANVLVELGGIEPTADWYEGAWSNRRGHPTAVAIAEGRLCWSGKDKVWLSASDAYETFDDLYAGDGETIARTIGSGPVSNINWMAAVSRLLLGADGAAHEVKSSSDEEPLTPSNAHIKAFSTQGSSNVDAMKLDDSAIFVQRGGTRVMEASFGDNFKYQAADLTTFFPEAGSSKIVRIGVQRQPDTRIHCVRADGSVMILLHDKAEEVSCWVKYTTDGEVEDVVVLPGADGDGEDAVYYLVKREIQDEFEGVVRYLEKWSLEAECQGGTTNYNMDSAIAIAPQASTLLTGLDHLIGKRVVVWADGAYVTDGYVSLAGELEIGQAIVTGGCVGIPYTAPWKSTKLAYATRLGTSLIQSKQITNLGVIMRNTHYQGLEYGPDFTNMDNLPKTLDGAVIAADTVHDEFDDVSFAFDGSWDSDSRLCLRATAPYPVTLLAAIIGVESHGRY